MGVHDTFWFARRAAGGDDECITVDEWNKRGRTRGCQRGDVVGGDHDVSSEMFQELSASGDGQPLVDGQNGVTRLPGANDIRHELVTSRQIERDQAWHERNAISVTT